MKEITSPSVSAEFERFLRVFHYLVISNTCQDVGGLEIIAAKASVSLLRYADLFPADRAFYEAGYKAKVSGIIKFVRLHFFKCLLFQFKGYRMG